MGSKRSQLENGLGHQLKRVVKPGDHFVDLFSGSGVVSWFAATKLEVQVTAVDLQNYAVLLSGSVIQRTSKIDVGSVISNWTTKAARFVELDSAVDFERRLMSSSLDLAAVIALRKRASQHDDVFVRSYAGHYFSIEQALLIGTLRATLPSNQLESDAALAALISAASRCSSSPGHTAQPFQPTINSLPHIDKIWRRSLIAEVEAALYSIGLQHASIEGRAIQDDANSFVETLSGNEVVFVDPPYSAAQYSRFYHVLESIAVGGYTEVFGAGRAPHISNRERSDYSMISTARNSLRGLLQSLAGKNCRVIATFPQYKASNGMSGLDIASDARAWFDVDTSMSIATFSTLGGNGLARSARHQAQEMILTMYPK